MGHAGEEKKVRTECHLGPPKVETREEEDEIVPISQGKWATGDRR